MQTQVRTWLGRLGFPTDVEILPLAPGLGNTEMWHIVGAGAHDDMVARIFPATNTVSAPREALAMRAASAAGLPVPAIVAVGELDGHPALLMAHVPGETAAAALSAQPERAASIGERMGRLLGAINRIPAPAGLAPPDAWLARAGPALLPYAERLLALPHPDRLLHLDYHPENVLVAGDAITGVIDWTNTLPGPPHLDLGRSRAILGMVRELPDVPAATVAVVERLEAALIAGHAAVHGPDPAPDLTLAWGLGMHGVDLARHAGMPGSWVTDTLVRRLEDQRDALLARVTKSA